MVRMWMCAALLSVVLSPAAYAADGPIAAYSFNEGFGSAVADASGNGNTGTAAGTTWVAGRNGGAISFAGSNSSDVTVADKPALRLTTGMTLEAWVNPDTLGTRQRVADGDLQADAAARRWATRSTPTTAQRPPGRPGQHRRRAERRRHGDSCR